MTIAFVALGSNLSNPLLQVETAATTLAQHPDLSVLAISPWYRSAAIGPGEQADYINGVIKLESRINTPLELLDELQRIENDQGRTREVRWGPRTLDLDLLLFGTEAIHSERLTLPHPRISERNFVLFPFRDLAPDVLIEGLPVSVHAKAVSSEGIWKLDGVAIEP